MSYVNPLHIPVGSGQQSGYSSLNGAVAGSQQTSQFLSPFRRRMPQPAYAAVGKFRNATGRSNVVHSAISFDYLGHKRQGVPMRELSTRSIPGLAQMIEGAGDKVLAHTGLQRITLRINWPGYTHIEWARSIEITVNGPITRAELGQKVAQNFSRFIEMNRGQKPTSLDFHMGQNGIRFEHVILVGLMNVFEDSWQADVAVDLR
ncbi:hypothetical protein B0H34DRAFT_787242 [Crassisporium funariophilum]|nr:hypothetical protein B0H34DRAFT_787242 [Crassisporium funariophilum]